MGRLDAVGRVAHFLCEANARLMLAGLSDGRRFALGVTQNDLAEICGLTNVHVNRVLRSLREERLCIFRSSLVEIIDPARLAARGQFDPAYLCIDEDALAAIAGPFDRRVRTASIGGDAGRPPPGARQEPPGTQSY